MYVERERKKKGCGKYASFHKFAKPIVLFSVNSNLAPLCQSAEGQCYILCCRYAVVMCFRCVGCSESNVQIGVAHENESHITSLYQNVWRG
jgi:hypothetical protein